MLEIENRVLKVIISGLEQNIETLKETIRSLIKEQRDAEYTFDADKRTNAAFLSVIRMKLNDGMSREEVCQKITEFLEA